jgi:carbon-monoxide dehydrogenase large subunit
VGEAVAVVVADSAERARDAAENVVVEYEPLPVVVDLDAAIDAGTPLVHASLGANVCFHQQVVSADVDAAFGRADRVVERRIVNQRVGTPRMRRPGGIGLLCGSARFRREIEA